MGDREMGPQVTSTCTHRKHAKFIFDRIYQQMSFSYFFGIKFGTYFSEETRIFAGDDLKLLVNVTVYTCLTIN